MDREPVVERFLLVRSAREVEVLCEEQRRGKAESPGNGVMRIVSVALVSH